MIRSVLVTLLLAVSAFAQDFGISQGGSRPNDAAVVKLIRAYTPHLLSWKSIEDRDTRRRPMVTSSYFYHDLNGSDIGFDGLTARHTKNDLRVSEGRIFDAILYQEENSAVLTYKFWTKGMDKGHSFEGTGSAAIVMTRTADGWRVSADIMGQDPPEQARPE
jgi:hypothetical protein